MTLTSAFYPLNAEEIINLKTTNVTGDPSEYVVVSVNMDKNSSMTAITIELAYESSVLLVENLATDISYGAIMKGMNQSNVIGSKIIFTCISTNKILDEGEIFTIKFKIRDDAMEGTYPIVMTVKEFSSTDNLFNAVNIPYVVENGSVTVKSSGTNTTTGVEHSNSETKSVASSGTKIVSPMPTTTPAPTPIEFNPTNLGNHNEFVDLMEHDWSKEAIYKLAEKGIVNGTSESTFAPEQQIKRADYLLLMVRMLGLTANVVDNFSDVADDIYYYKEIGIAKALGLTDGVGDNKFTPEEPITRQDMFVIACRMMKKLNKINTQGETTILNKYNDSAEVSEYAKIDFATLVELGLVKGSDNLLNPKNNATRAETAVFVYRIYGSLNK